MNLNKTFSVRHVAFGAIFLIVVFSITVRNFEQATPEKYEVKTSVQMALPLDTSEKDDEFLYPVVGKVSAKQELMIKAKQAGVVENILVTEGDVLASGKIMAVQVDPVLQAQLARQGIQNVLSLLREESAVSVNKQNLSTQEVSLAQAGALLTVSSSTNNNRIVSAQAQLKNELQSVSAAVVDIFSFVKNNPSFFTADSMKLYRNSVDSFYGRNPNYLSLGIMYPNSNTIPLFKQIESLKDSKNSEDEVIVSQAVIAELSQVLKIFSESESEFLDSDILSRDDSLYTSYTNYRSGLTNLKSALESSLDNLSTLKDYDNTNSINLDSANKQAQFGYEGALTQSKIADALYENTNALTKADRQVLFAQVSLGVSQSPFAGIVSHVLVEEGEYVMTGTPLFIYVGTGNQEIKIKLPESLLGKVKKGSEFYIAGEIYGQVSRIVSVVESGSITVFVDLVKPVVTGTTLNGHLSLDDVGENSQNLKKINRNQLLFSTKGPYVTTESGEQVFVQVISDNGNILIVKFEKEVSKKLQTATGIRL
jgi:multidrug efflux pump subunit AcrA (membrane-fusion protein)